MKAGALTDALGLILSGDPEVEITALAPLERAGKGELGFVADPRHRNAMRESQASLLIVPESLAGDCPVDHIVSPSPYASYASASWLLTPEHKPPPGTHPTAVVDPSARIGADVSIGPFTTIGAGAWIDDRVVIDAGCHVADGVRIGAGTRLFANVTLGLRVVLGEACRAQSGSVIGGEGFGFAPTKEGWLAIHQTGGVRVGDRVQIGANTTIDSGAIDPTVIEDGVILDNLIQIAHNVHIGQNTAIAGCTGISGSTHIGRNCLIGGACNISGHLSIADGVTVNGTSFVSRSITERGVYGSGTPLQSVKEWRRTFAALPRLNDILRRVRRLEKAISREDD